MREILICADGCYINGGVDYYRRVNVYNLLMIFWRKMRYNENWGGENEDGKNK